MSLAQRVRRRGDLPRHRRRGPGPHRRLEARGSASASTTSPSSATASIPTDLIFDMLTFPLGSGSGGPPPRRHRDHRGDPAGRRPSCPGSSTVLGLSNVSFGLKPAIRHVLNSVFLHECREAGLDAAIVHAARIMPMHKIDDHVREVTLDLIYDRRARRLRPAHRADGAVRGRRGRRGRAGGPLRLADRASGSSTASSTATATASRPTSRSSSRSRPGAVDRQRRAARGHEGRRRPVRRGRDAAAVRAAERGDDEGRGRLPRAAHGEGRRRRQGPRRASAP